MIDTKKLLDYTLAFGVPAVLGAISTVALEKVTTRWGHAYTQFGIKNTALVATIGAIQNVAFFTLVSLVNDKINKKYELISLCAINLSVGAAVVGLTALAAKTNLIPNQLGLGAGLLLSVTNMLSVVALAAGAEHFNL